MMSHGFCVNLHETNEIWTENGQPNVCIKKNINNSDNKNVM